jgi:hypothetical protein
MSRPLLLALILFSPLCANGQSQVERKELVKRFCLSTAYTVRNPHANVPLQLRALVRKAWKVQFEKAYGPLVFRSKLLRPHEGRVMLCSFRQGGSYLSFYRHGHRGVHYHVLYVDQAKRLADFYDFHSAATECGSMRRTLGEMEVSEEKGPLSVADLEA